MSVFNSSRRPFTMLHSFCVKSHDGSPWLVPMALGLRWAIDLLRASRLPSCRAVAFGEVD
jgi:hypothetical protein